MPPVTVSPAGPSDLPAAGQALFAHLPEPERSAQAAHALGLFAAGEFDPAGLLVARVGTEIVGAVLSQLTPGNAAVVWPPRAEPGADHATATAALARAVVGRLRDAGVKLAQTFTAPGDRPAAGPLVAAGFRHVTRVEFLCRPINPVADRAAFEPAASPLIFEPVADPDPAFGELLLATYDGTLDCPELNGTRTADEVVAGHRSPGEGSRWWRARREGEPVGVVLFAPGTSAGVLDLSYVGLVPAARGRGLGATLVGFALREAAVSAAEWLNVSVDVRNAPARHLYQARKFRPYDVQEVFLWRADW